MASGLLPRGIDNFSDRALIHWHLICSWRTYILWFGQVGKKYSIYNYIIFGKWDVVMRCFS